MGDIHSVNQLSARERVCLSWAARGKSSSDIGVILDISENTVRFHLKNAMKKLATSSRIVAAIKATQLGLIESPVEPDAPGVVMSRQDLRSAPKRRS
jgi:DNA-binding CsgD family transcriptional regulator